MDGEGALAYTMVRIEYSVFSCHSSVGGDWRVLNSEWRIGEEKREGGGQGSRFGVQGGSSGRAEEHWWQAAVRV